MKFKTVLLLVVFLLGSSVAFADNHGAVVAIEATIDYNDNTPEDDLYVDQGYLAGWYESTDGYVYARSEMFQADFVSINGDTIQYQSQRFEIDELYGKLYFFDLDWKLGKVLLPFGFDYLSRPETSVFITAPDKDLYGFGLHLGVEYGFLGLDGAYLGKGHYSVRSTATLFDGMNTISFAVNNVPEIKERYGRFAITNMFKYGSTFFDVSNLVDYNPDNGDFWTRMVIAPGIFDSIGIFGGYYNVNEMHNGLHDFDHNVDSWTYGAYLDLSPNAGFTIEWMNSHAFNPLSMELTITF